jgi:hypothetical protein
LWASAHLSAAMKMSIPEPLIHGGAQERGHIVVSSGAPGPRANAASHVLATMEISPPLVRGAVRVSWVGAPERPMSNALLPLGEGLQMQFRGHSIVA